MRTERGESEERDPQNEPGTRKLTLRERVESILTEGTGIVLTASITHTQPVQIEGEDRTLELSTIIAGFKEPVSGAMTNIADALIRVYSKAGLRPIPTEIYEKRVTFLNNKLFFADLEEEKIVIVGIRIFDDAKTFNGMETDFKETLETTGSYGFGLSQRSLKFLAGDIFIHKQAIKSPDRPAQEVLNRRRLLARVEILNIEEGLAGDQIADILGVEKGSEMYISLGLAGLESSRTAASPTDKISNITVLSFWEGEEDEPADDIEVDDLKVDVIEDVTGPPPSPPPVDTKKTVVIEGPVLPPVEEGPDTLLHAAEPVEPFTEAPASPIVIETTSKDVAVSPPVDDSLVQVSPDIDRITDDSPKPPSSRKKKPRVERPMLVRMVLDRNIASRFSNDETYPEIAENEGVDYDIVVDSIRRSRRDGIVGRRRHTAQVYADWREKILGWKKAGKTDEEIVPLLSKHARENITIEQVKSHVVQLIAEKKFKSDEKRTKRLEDEKARVLAGRLAGKSYATIADEEGLKFKRVHRLVSILIEEKKLKSRTPSKSKGSKS